MRIIIIQILQQECDGEPSHLLVSDSDFNMILFSSYEDVNEYVRVNEIHKYLTAII
jgi:hypothetical protein